MKLTNYIRDAFITAAMQDVPKVDYDEQIRAEAVKVAVSMLPTKVQAAYKDKATRHYVSTMYLNVGGVGLYVPGLHDEGKTVEKKVREVASAMLESRKAQEEARHELSRKLRAVAYSVTTRKALADALPEFAKYLPADEAAACRQLPVVANVVAEFVKAGWPKGKKPATAKAGA